MSKKSRAKKPHGDKDAKLRHTLQNKISKLGKQLAKFPTDISASIALDQAKYDLSQVKYDLSQVK